MGTQTSVMRMLDEIDGRLGNITEGNGYWYTLKKKARGKLKVFESHDLPSANYWATGVGNETAEYFDDKRTLPLFIELHSMTMDYPFIDVAEKLASDGLTAITRLPADSAGRSVGIDAAQTDMSGSSDTKIKISADGDAAEEVTCVWTGATTGALVAAQMQTKIQALGGNKAAVTVAFNKRYIITSGTTGITSAIVITPGDTLDCSDQLRIGISNNGLEYIGLAAAPAVSDIPNYNLNDTVERLVFFNYTYFIGEGQTPWCGVIIELGVVFHADPFDMYIYRGS